MTLGQLSSIQEDDPFVEVFSCIVKQSKLSQAEIVRRTNERIAAIHSSDLEDVALMITPVTGAMLSYMLNAKRNISAQELRKICFFGLGLSSEECNFLETLRQQDRSTQAELPAVEIETEPSVPSKGYPLPDWLSP